MNISIFPELFCLISFNLNDKEKISLISCSKIIYNFKLLLMLDSEYYLEEINNNWRVKNILIKDFSLESEHEIKELLKDLIPESIVVNSKYTKFISNNTNIKLFYSEEIINKLVYCEYSYLAMKIMLNNDESINNINEQFKEASWRGYLDVVKLLINLGADISIDNNDAIITASRQGRLSMVELLIELGADVHAQNNLAIIEASASGRGNLSMVKLLIENGADVHAQNNQSIIWASCNDHLSVVKLLINSGADIHAQNNKAFKYAERYEYWDLIKLLKN